MNKRFLLFTMFILILSISAVNAHDNIADDIGDLNNQTNQLKTDEIGSFIDLNDEISKIVSGGNLTLKKDYAYNSNDSDYRNGIKITEDNILIDGDGHTIDGAGQARIFDIASNNVTLQNINFINGHSSENGGAIYVENAFFNCKINSTFINNSAYNGGAIFFNDAVNNITINGYFKDNNAERSGGAIYVKGKSVNSTFASEFYNNRANAASGGAIFFYKLVENNIFESIFKSNYALYGAGMFFYKKANNNRFNSDFRFNVAKSCGGAMFFYNTTNNNAFSGYFINNSALGQVDEVNGNGGAITFKNTSTNSIFTCDFVNNTAARFGGGVNYRETPYNITFNGNFINNNAGTGGGVNFYESFENVVFGGQFIGNNATYGGALATKTGVIKNTSFRNNHAKLGGAVYFMENGTIDGSNFTCNAAEDGGAILTYGNLTVSNSRFENNTATLGTDHISLKENATLNLRNVYPTMPKPFYIGYLTVLNVSNVKYGETVSIVLNVTDENHNSFNEGTVSCSIDGNIYAADVENGSANITIPNLSAGNYKVNLTFVGELAVAISQVEFNVLKQDAVIMASNKAYIINYGGKYTITLKDANNNTLSGKTLKITLSGKNIKSGATNDEGVLFISLTGELLKSVKAGKKTLVLKFVDSNYNTTSKTVKITVNKEKTKIVAKNKKFNKAKKVKKYTISLKNSKGNAVKKVSVTLKVKGKTYKTKTNSKGKATFKITNLNKKGKFNAVVKFAGNKYYKIASKKVKITVK